MATKPHATDDHFSFDETQTIQGNLLSNDVAGSNGKMFLRFFDGAGVDAKGGLNTVTEVAGEYGTFYVKPDGSFSYVLSDASKLNFTDGETLTEHLTYKISDGSGNTDVGVLDLKINGVTQNPIAVDDTFNFDLGDTISGNVLANDIAGDNGKLFLRSWASTTVDGNPAHSTVVAGVYGDFTVKVDGSFVYTLHEDATVEPGGEIVESVQFYKLSDGSGHTDVGTVNIHIHAPAEALV